MKSSYAGWKERPGHTFCWKNGRWGYESSNLKAGEIHWMQTLQACLIPREDGNIKQTTPR